MSGTIWQKGIPAGSLLGIPLYLHVLLPALVIVQIVITAIRYSDRDASDLGVQIGFVALAYGPILFITVLIHELGHCLAARQVGGTADRILLWPLGGIAFIAHDKGPKKDIWVSFAGPLTHVPMFAFWVACTFLAEHRRFNEWSLHLHYKWIDPSVDFLHAICLLAVWMQIVLCAFNLLLPAYPLDGGRIFADVLLIAGVAPLLAAQIVVGVAVGIAIGIIAWGFVSDATSLILVGLWMAYSSYSLVKFISAGMIEQHPLFKFDDDGQPTANREFDCVEI